MQLETQTNLIVILEKGEVSFDFQIDIWRTWNIGRRRRRTCGYVEDEF